MATTKQIPTEMLEIIIQQELDKNIDFIELPKFKELLPKLTDEQKEIVYKMYINHFYDIEYYNKEELQRKLSGFYIDDNLHKKRTGEADKKYIRFRKLNDSWTKLRFARDHFSKYESLLVPVPKAIVPSIKDVCKTHKSIYGKLGGYNKCTCGIYYQPKKDLEGKFAKMCSKCEKESNDDKVKSDWVEREIKHFENTLKLSSETVEKLNAIGAELIGKDIIYKKAIKWCDEALKINPKDESALLVKGFSLKELQRYGEAFEYYKKVLEIKPENKDYKNSVEELEQKIKESKSKSKESSEKPPETKVEIPPKEEEPKTYSSEKINKTLLENRKKLDELATKHIGPIDFSRMEERNRKELDAFFASYDFSKKIEHESPEARLYELGNKLKDVKEYEKALECFNDALKINPNYKKALFEKAHVLDNLKRHEEADKIYDELAPKGPSREEILEAYKNLKSTLQNKDVEKTESPLKEEVPEGDIQMAKNDAPREEGELEEWPPEEDDSHPYEKGKNLYHNGKYKEALEQFECALKINPNDATARNGKENCLLALAGKVRDHIL